MEIQKGQSWMLSESDLISLSRQGKTRALHGDLLRIYILAV